MSINYGTDRVFVGVTACQACGISHGEQEFKRISAHTARPADVPAEATHRARCPRKKCWVYIRLENDF